MNPNNTPSEPGPQTSREAKPEQQSKVGNDRGGRSESTETEKERRSNLAGDQDVDDAGDTGDRP